MPEPSSARAADRRLSLADLYRIRTVQHLCVSPDGATAIAVVEESLRKADRRVTNLWRVDLAGTHAPLRLTTHLGDDRAPRWSPDGTRAIFLSARPDAWPVTEAEPEADPSPRPAQDTTPKPRTQVWLLDLARGGEASQLSHLAEGVDAAAWAPDGRRLVLAARAPDEAQARHLAALRDGKAPHVLDRTQHKYDGVGFYDDVNTHLFVLDIEDGSVVQITRGPCSERSPAWSPDGRWIAFVSNRTGDADNNHRDDLWLVSPDGAEAKRLTRGDVKCGAPVWSPDGRRLAAIVTLVPENAYVLSHVGIVEMDDALPVKDLAACVGEGFVSIGGVVPDTVDGDPVENARRYPVPAGTTPLSVPTRDLDRVMLGPIRWLDAARLLTLGGDRGQTRLVEVDASPAGNARAVYPHDRSLNVDAFDAAAGTVAFVLSSPELGREVASLSQDRLGDAMAEPRRASAFFAPLRTGRTLAPYHRVAFTADDGVTVEALVVLPPGFDPKAPHPAPLLVSIHGGPQAYDAPGFRFERQYWAAQGYLVLMVNYRGSTSYGEAFGAAIRGCWGPREHADLMAGVDHLLSLGWTTPDRLFITGFSYGGIMTNWAIGHTDRFRAAVSEHGLWDYGAAFGTDDCHLWWQDDIGVPWQNPQAYRSMSPSSGVAGVHTPVLIMAGAEDWRCPVDQSEMMYMALKKRGVATRLVVYPDEHHAVTKPSRAIDRLTRIGLWLQDHGGLPLTPAGSAGADA